MTEAGEIVVERDLMVSAGDGCCWRPMYAGRKGRARFRYSWSARSTTHRRREIRAQRRFRNLRILRPAACAAANT
jgi:hypothetical protein